MVVTFIGHSDTSYDIEPILKETIENLITNFNANLFYIGTHGNFDTMAKKCIIQLKQNYPHIKYYCVLAYIPRRINESIDYSDTIFPSGIEKAPPKFAIIQRNNWMIENAEIVICYVRHTFSNSSKFLKIAQKKEKIIINLYKKI